MSKINKRSFRLRNDINEKIIGDIRLPAGRTKLPAVFIVHGFKGFKDWGFVPYLSEFIASSGAIALTFNFSLSGKLDNDSEMLDDVDKFAANTAYQQLCDLATLIEAFRTGTIIGSAELDAVWDGRIFLLGHSMGGAVSIITAKERNYVNKISLWASISTFERYTKRQKSVWRRNGSMEFVNMKTNQGLRLDLSFLEDIEKNKQRYDLPLAINRLTIPVQIIHGTQDLTVPLKEAEILANAAADRGNLFLTHIPQTGHTFGVDHPFVKSTPALDTAIMSTVKFFGLTD